MLLPDEYRYSPQRASMSVVIPGDTGDPVQKLYHPPEVVGV